eukprot:SAG31_NODE_2753_length_5141_cov_3.640619_5_plen_99_part_00
MTKWCFRYACDVRLFVGLRCDFLSRLGAHRLQLVYTFYCLIRAKETRDAILGSNDHLPIVELMIDMLQDKHEAIRRIAGNLLDVVRKSHAQKIQVAIF